MPISGAVKYTQRVVPVTRDREPVVRAGFMLMPESGAASVT
jgi:hypothetical protein